MTRQELEDLQAEKLTGLLRSALSDNPFYSHKLRAAGLTEEHVERATTLAGLLSRLPLTTKRELEDDQRAHPPYGSNLSLPVEAYVRLHQTSGTTGDPLRWLDTVESWAWFGSCWATIFEGMGLRADDRLFFPFSFGPFIGFWAAFDAASRLGRTCLSGGGMGTPARLRFLCENRATVVLCTPTYALRMAEVAAAEGIDLASTPVRAVLVAGEPGGSVASTRGRIEAAWGARVFDHCGMTEAGAFGFEVVESPGHLYVVESEFVVEVLDPETCEPVPDGECGELVLTNLGRLGSPVIRYRSGDLVRWRRPSLDEERPGPESVFGRLEGGILARRDDMVIVRGNNLYPSALEALLREFPEVTEFRVRICGAESRTEVEIELEPAAEVDGRARNLLAPRVAAAIEKRFLFQAKVEVVAPGSLPRFELKARRFVNETNSGQRRPL